MTRIVSGSQDPDYGFSSAILKGQEIGANYQRARLANQENARQEKELQLKMQHAMFLHQQEKTKTQQLLNHRAQMGEAAAFQQLAQKQALEENPEAMQVQDMLGALGKIDDPQAHALALASFQGLLKQQEKAKQKAAVEKMIDEEGQNGIIDPKDMQLRLASGEEPQAIAQEIMKAKHEATVSHMAKTHSEEMLPQMQALVQTARPGSPERLKAEHMLAEFQISDTQQAKPGEAEKRLKAIQDALIVPTAEARSRSKEDRRQRLRTVGMASQAPRPEPGTPAYKKYAVEKKAEKEKRYPATAGGKKAKSAQVIISVLQGSKDEADFYANLQAQGIDPANEEDAKLIMEALGADTGGQTSMGPYTANSQ